MATKEAEPIEEEGNTLCHSCAHVLGAALCILYPKTHLAIGPPLKDNGFYYEGDIAKEDGSVLDAKSVDLLGLEEVMKRIIAEKQEFIRIELSKDELLKKFEGNPFKEYLIRTKVTEDRATVYKSGNFEDLCRGPHIKNTSLCKNFKLTQVTEAEFNISEIEKKKVLRVYGVCFEKEEDLALFIKQQEQEKFPEHIRLGKELQLFIFDEKSPGSAFFLPQGTRIFVKLQDYLRKLLKKHNYKEVMTPQIFKIDLWKESGHWDKYQENMFQIESESTLFAVKPMNCPGHCLIFRSQSRSYRELPLRMAEFGCCHRNELSGTLRGLTRVRRFTQDDAHIFCDPQKIGEEIEDCLSLMKEVYSTFGLQYSFNLSTRPEKFLGEITEWDRAE